MIEGTPEAIEEMLGPKVDIGTVAGETNHQKVTALAFELYKEAMRVLNLAAHILDQSAAANGGLPRDQAICAGLLIRMVKFMLATIQLTCETNRSEVALSLSRSIMESAINLEFLVRANDDKHFNDFVEYSLGPERELYDLIQTNISQRNGEVLPIEKRMLGSINDLCGVSGVKIEDVHSKHRSWGGDLRQRLKFLNKEHQYVIMVRVPSHAVHGSWVDLYTQHLEYDAKTNVFTPDPRWSRTDARAYGPIAVFALDAVQPYIENFFGETPERAQLLARLEDLRHRILVVDEAHEKLMSGK